MTTERSVNAEALICAPVHLVYRTLVTREGWEAWFTRRAALRPEVGGEICFHWNIFDGDQVGSVETGRIVEATPDRCVAFAWTGHGIPTSVRFTLERQDQRTLLRVSESGQTIGIDDERCFDHLAFGWNHALSLLKRYLETGARFT